MADTGEAMHGQGPLDGPLRVEDDRRHTVDSGGAATIVEPPELSNAKSRERTTSGWWTALALGVLALAVALPLRNLLRSPGPAMEEGFMLTFPDRILHGDMPHRDFLDLYGPGSFWALAGLYKLFGVRIMVERMVGLAQLVAITLAVFAIVRRWNRWMAVAGGLVTLLFLLPVLGLTAIPWAGGVALGLISVVMLIRAREESCADEREQGPWHAERWALLGGVFGGFALLYRIDLGLGVVLAGGAAVWGLQSRVVRRAVTGFVIGLSPYVVHTALAGPGNVWRGMIVDPIFHLRDGRHLPVPPDPSRLVGVAGVIRYIDRSWPLPKLEPAQQLFVWFVGLFGVAILVAVVAIWAVRRQPDALRPRVLLAATLFGLGTLPQAVQRADSAHLAWVSAITLTFVPCAVAEVVRILRPAWRPLRAGTFASVALLLCISLVLPSYTSRRYAALVQDSLSGKSGSIAITHDDRTFYIGDDPSSAQSLNDLLAAVDRLGHPGERVVVSPGDFARTPYNDSYLYYLLPRLHPGTYFIEMEPGITNRPGTRLTEELRRTDMIIESTRWLTWNEPNSSMKPGDPRPNEVVRKEFCRAGDFGHGLRLLVRCGRQHA